MLKGNTANAAIVCMVQQEADIGQAKEPGVRRSTSTVHNAVCSILDGLKATFRRILLLLMRFTLPITNAEGAEDVKNLLTDFDLRTITDELRRSTTISNIIFQGVDKLAIGFDAVNVSYLSIKASKDNSCSSTVVDSRDVRVYNIASNRLVTTSDIERWVRGLEAAL